MRWSSCSSVGKSWKIFSCSNRLVESNGEARKYFYGNLLRRKDVFWPMKFSKYYLRNGERQLFFLFRQNDYWEYIAINVFNKTPGIRNKRSFPKYSAYKKLLFRSQKNLMLSSLCNWQIIEWLRYYVLIYIVDIFDQFHWELE